MLPDISILRNTKSWPDFVEAITPLRQDERGAAFEGLTELYLQIQPEYRTKLKTIWHHSEVPAKVRNKLSLPVQDFGIDLVAETYDGDYWAIQCKYHHDPHKNLTLNELRSFLHAAHQICQDKFSMLLAVSSANGYADTLQKRKRPWASVRTVG